VFAFLISLAAVIYLTKVRRAREEVTKG